MGWGLWGGVYRAGSMGQGLWNEPMGWGLWARDCGVGPVGVGHMEQGLWSRAYDCRNVIIAFVTWGSSFLTTGLGQLYTGFHTEGGRPGMREICL